MVRDRAVVALKLNRSEVFGAKDSHIASLYLSRLGIRLTLCVDWIMLSGQPKSPRGARIILYLRRLQPVDNFRALFYILVYGFFSQGYSRA